MAHFLPFGRGSQRGDTPMPDRFDGVQAAVETKDLEALAEIVGEVAASREKLDVLLWLDLCQSAFLAQGLEGEVHIVEMMNRVSGWCAPHQQIQCKRVCA